MKKKIKWSFILGKIFGIKISVHWSFIFFIGWIFIMYIQMGNNFMGAMLGVAFVLIVFVCVVLHELGHVLVAKRFNVDTKNIIILPIGGMSMMEHIPEKPGQEFLMSIAGPLVNIVIGIGLYFFLSATGGIPTMEQITAMQENETQIIAGDYFFFNLMVVNLLLAVFNLIPAFPMDGGRVLRAILSNFFERSKATIFAARIGQFFAILLIFAGFYANFWLIIIGIFIFLSAGSESMYETAKTILSKYKVKDIYMKNYTALSPMDTLEKAVNVLLNGQDQEFLVMEKGTVIGLCSRENIIEGLSKFGKNAPVSKVMQKNFYSFQTEMELQEAYSKMMSEDYFFGPIYDKEKLVGLLDGENIREFISVKQAIHD